MRCDCLPLPPSLFVRMPAREALFEGYTDPLFSWLAKQEAEEAG